MSYQLTSTDSILRQSDGASIPFDPLNSDYREYLAWCEAGNTPEPAPVAPVVIPTLSMRQLVEWLILSGQLAAVEAVLTAITNPAQHALAMNWWNRATTVERSHPLVAQLGEAIGFTPSQIDDAFMSASVL